MKKYKNINIVIPMAGRGSRFYEKGYLTPKPFIEVHGKMMIERVLDNLQCPQANYILIMLQEHMNENKKEINRIIEKYNAHVLPISNLTDGPACTVLAAHRLINNEVPLLIANSDQIVDIKITDYIDNCFNKNLDGSILTFKNKDKKWSYAKTNTEGFVTEVKEKVPISDNATVGIYLFAKGNDFINSSMDMIARADKTNNEYYVCPVYNYIIKQNKKIGVYEIRTDQMHGTGTPEDLEKYLSILSLYPEDVDCAVNY